MKPEQQQIAIGELCGWKHRKWQDRKGRSCTGWPPPHCDADGDFPAGEDDDDQ